MASKPPTYTSSPFTMASSRPLADRLRRGSITSTSSRLQVDNERMSQTLDQIHITASQSDTLTTFNDFTPAPSSQSGSEGKGLAGELQGGLSGLYSRFRASVGGVTNLVGSLTTGEEKGPSGNKPIESPESSIHSVRETPGAGKTQGSVVSSPIVEVTSTSRLQSPTAPLDSVIDGSIPFMKVPESSSSMTVMSPKLPGSSGQSDEFRSALTPLPKVSTSSVANQRVAEVQVVAVKDAGSLTDIGSGAPTGSSHQGPLPDELSAARPHVREKSDEQRRFGFTAVGSQKSNHQRNGTQGSSSGHSISDYHGPPTTAQDGHSMYTTASVDSTDEKVLSAVVVEPGSSDGLQSRRDKSSDHHHSRHSSGIADSHTSANVLQVEPKSQTSLTKDSTDGSSGDHSIQGSGEYTPTDSGLNDSTSTNRVPALSRVSQSHLPGFTISHASSSDDEQSSPVKSSTSLGLLTRGSVPNSDVPVMSRKRTELLMPSNESSSTSANVVLSQTRSKVLSRDYWMKDENAKDCFYCGDPFSTFRRKHHCRTCGQIFDAKCTSLVSGSQFGQSGDLRVCKPCEAIISGYDSSDHSGDDTPYLQLSPKRKHNTVIPVRVHGQIEAALPGSTSQHSGRSPDHRGLGTPNMTIPATRRSGGAGQQTGVLEFGAERTVPRPNSSRSLRTITTGRPHSSNHKRHYSRHQHLRSIRPSLDDKAPFHGRFANDMHKETRRSAFHNDSIIDPDLAPFMSDEDSSGDEQVSISTVLSTDVLSKSHDNDKSAISGLLSAVRKGRLRFGEVNIGGVTFGSRDVDDVSTSSSRAAGSPRHTRKRSLSVSSYVHQRPVRSYKGGAVPTETLQEDIFDTHTPVSGPVNNAFDRSKTVRSSSMTGAGAPAVELNNASLQHVRKLLRQLLQDSEVSKPSSWERALVPILLQATDDVDPDVQSGDDLDIRHYVKLKKIPGGRPSDTCYVSGLVFSKNLALKSMPRTMSSPRIVIVTFPLEYARHRQHFMSLEPVIRQEREFLENLVNRIAALRPQLLLVQRNVSGLALEFLERAKIATAFNLKPSVIEAVSRCTQTRIISSIDKLAIKPAQAGKCSNFELKTYVNNGRKKTYMYLSGCPKELGCTIVLRGADDTTLAKVKRITEFMVYVVYNLKLETCLMRDEFAFIRSSTESEPPLVMTTVPNTANPIAMADTPAERGEKPFGHQQNKPTSPDISNADLLGGERGTLPQLNVASSATSVDLQTPEDIPAPTFYGDMVEKHKTKILSASPFVEFMQPYLLMQAREQERRLVYLKRLKDQDNREEQTAVEDGESKKFDLIKPEMVHATIHGASRKVREVLHAVHDAEYDKALHNYETQKRQWETYISGNINLFDPYAHQNIAVLYSLVCTVTSVPCSGPDLLALGFYNEHETEAEFEADCTLGQYVEDLCFGANTICTANGCERRMFEHHRQYVHGEAQINIFVQQHPCRIRGMQDIIMMWSCCRICGNETQIMPMSKNSWKYSFGKYLELSFWSSHLHARADVCPHDLHRDHIRYFGFRNMAIRVQYDSISLLEIIVPRARITWKVDNDLRLKNDIFVKTEERLNRFMASVKARIDGISNESIVAEKAEACKAEVEKMMKLAEDEHHFLIKKLQDKYMSSKYYEIVPLNRAIRAMMEKVAEWDNTFADFDNNYFPSEKDIRRLATLQLKKIFLDREGSASTLASPRDSLSTPSADMELSEKMCPGGSIELESKPLESQHPLTSVINETSKSQNEDDTHIDGESKVEAIPEHPLTIGCLQDSSMQSISHLDLALPSNFPERISGDQQALRPESRPVSPTTTRRKDHGDRELFSSAIPAEAPAAGQDNEASRLITGSDNNLADGPASRIPRPSGSESRRSDITFPPPLLRAHSQPAHLLRKQSNASSKTSLAMPHQNLPNEPSKTFSKKLESALSHSAASAGERKGSDKLDFAAVKSDKSITRHSLIPRSVASRRKDSRVSTLAKHFEQLSREFEKERIRERRQRAAKTRHARAYPMASSKPIAQVYKNVHEAVEEKDPSDEDLFADEQRPTSASASRTTMEKMAQSTITKTLGEGFYAETSLAETTETEENAQTVSLTASDAEGEGDRSDEDHPVNVDAHIPSSNTEQLTVTPTEAQFDLKTELPKHERNSLVKLLTNFWAERSASGWTALEYPMGPSDHVFVDSDIIVREDEPSSLIALALDCDDYQAKLRSIRSHGGQTSNDPEKVNSVDIDGDMKKQGEVERSLLRSTGTHLKYQFQEGAAKMACKIFFAEQFDAVRKKCGVSERIIESLSRCLKWDSKGGKTKSVFLKTLDDRLVLKSLSQTEVQTFLSFAPAYFQIMSEALFHELPSVIAKMLGFYQVIIKNPVTGIEFNWFLLVMENLFYDRTPTRIFDLKGSMRNRKIQSTGEENEVLLDENMVEFIYENPLFAREHSKRLLRASVWNDTLFLARQNVMDYSLMIAIDENRKELVVGIIDCIRTYTWDKKLESWIKDRGFAGGGRNRPTVTSPKEYKSRFREAMARYVLEAPNCWHQFSTRRYQRRPLKIDPSTENKEGDRTDVEVEVVGAGV